MLFLPPTIIRLPLYMYNPMLSSSSVFVSMLLKTAVAFLFSLTWLLWSHPCTDHSPSNTAPSSAKPLCQVSSSTSDVFSFLLYQWRLQFPPAPQPNPIQDPLSTSPNLMAFAVIYIPITPYLNFRFQPLSWTSEFYVHHGYLTFSSIYICKKLLEPIMFKIAVSILSV